jgi:hypothetical protein
MMCMERVKRLQQYTVSSTLGLCLQDGDVCCGVHPELQAAVGEGRGLQKTVLAASICFKVQMYLLNTTCVCCNCLLCVPKHVCCPRAEFVHAGLSVLLQTPT